MSEIPAPDNSTCTVVFPDEVDSGCPPTGFFTECQPANFPPETACGDRESSGLCFSGATEPCDDGNGLRFCCIGDLTTLFPTAAPTPFPTISVQETRELYVNYPRGFIPTEALLPRGVQYRNASEVLFMPDNVRLSLSDDRYVYRTVGFIVREADQVITDVIINTLARATGVFPMNRMEPKAGFLYIEKRPLRSVFKRTVYAEVNYGVKEQPFRQNTRANCLIVDSSADLRTCARIPRCAGVLEGICYVGLSVFDEPIDENGSNPPPSRYIEKILDQDINVGVWIAILLVTFLLYATCGLPWKRWANSNKETKATPAQKSILI